MVSFENSSPLKGAENTTCSSTFSSRIFQCRVFSRAAAIWVQSVGLSKRRISNSIGCGGGVRTPMQRATWQWVLSDASRRRRNWSQWVKPLHGRDVARHVLHARSYLIFGPCESAPTDGINEQWRVADRTLSRWRHSRHTLLFIANVRPLSCVEKHHSPCTVCTVRYLGIRIFLQISASHLTLCLHSGNRGAFSQWNVYIYSQWNCLVPSSRHRSPHGWRFLSSGRRLFFPTSFHAASRRRCRIVGCKISLRDYLVLKSTCVYSIRRELASRLASAARCRALSWLISVTSISVVISRRFWNCPLRPIFVFLSFFQERWGRGMSRLGLYTQVIHK